MIGELTGWIIVGIIVMILFLIGQIRVGADLGFLSGKVTLAAELCGLRLQLIPKPEKRNRRQRKKTEEADDTGNRENIQQTQKEDNKNKKSGGKAGKKRKRFLKFDQYDLRELIAVILKGLKRFRNGFSCKKLLIHFTAAFPEPYTAARIAGYANAFLPVLYALVEKNNGQGCCDIRSDVDFNRKWPALDFEINITFRIGAAFGAVFAILFGAAGILLKVFFRFLWMRITDPEEYDFRINRQENPIQYFRRLIREFKAAKGTENAEEPKEPKEPEEDGDLSTPGVSHEKLLRNTAEQYASEHGYTVAQDAVDSGIENGDNKVADMALTDTDKNIKNDNAQNKNTHEENANDKNA